LGRIRYFFLPKNSKYRALKSILGFYPLKLSIYNQAFTHKSMVQTVSSKRVKLSNERLEFLGDALLGAIVADYFFKKYPEKEEGFLSNMRSKLVNRSFLNQLSLDLGLDAFIESSADISRRSAIYGDALEALLGAIYLDRGYSVCKNFVINKIIRDHIDLKDLIQTETNFKSKFIEQAQKMKKPYAFKIQAVETGQAKVFKCRLELDGNLVGIGEGKSKKRAEQMAAKKFFS